METYTAMRKAVGGEAAQVAKALRVSQSMVYKWCEPAVDFSQSGSFNPIDRLIEVVDVSLRLGKDSADAFAPISLLANHFGGVFLPPVDGSDITCPKMTMQLCRSMREAGEAFAAAGDALEDGEISPSERRKVVAAAYESLHELGKLVRMFEEA